MTHWREDDWYCACGVKDCPTLLDQERATAADERQDRLDGRALRRLRDALPEGRSFHCGWAPGPRRFYAHDEDSEWGENVRFYGHGDTIAAAADACRVAMEAAA